MWYLKEHEDRGQFCPLMLCCIEYIAFNTVHYCKIPQSNQYNWFVFCCFHKADVVMAAYDSYKRRKLIYIWNGYFNFCEGGSNVSVFLRIVLQQCGTAVEKQTNLKAL
jgi:hypothetical protein